MNEDDFVYNCNSNHVYDVKINHQRKISDNLYLCNVVVNSVEIKFEIDIGAERTLVCDKDYFEIWKINTDIVPNNTNIPLLRSYSGDLIPTLGTVDMLKC